MQIARADRIYFGALQGTEQRCFVQWSTFLCFEESEKIHPRTAVLPAEAYIRLLGTFFVRVNGYRRDSRKLMI